MWRFTSLRFSLAGIKILEGHTRVAYGTRKKVYKWKKWVKVLWWGYWDKGEKFKGYYYRIHDNGVDMGQHGGNAVYWEQQDARDTDFIFSQRAVRKN